MTSLFGHPGNKRTKEAQRERPCCGISLQFTHYTVWPRNEKKTLKKDFLALTIFRKIMRILK